MNDTLLNACAVVTGVTAYTVESPVVAWYLAIVTAICGTVAIVRTVLRIIKFFRDLHTKRITIDEAIDETTDIINDLSDDINMKGDKDNEA